MFSFRTLGALELRSPAGDDLGAVLGGPKLVALLAYLSVARPRGLHRRDTLVGLMWPELDQERARAALRHTAYRLRRVLGAGAIVSRGDEDIGIDAKIIRCDAAEFDALLDAGSVADALALYRGDLLPGFFLSGAPDFERWLDDERVRLRGRASSSASTYAADRARAGYPEEAAQWARRALTLAPDDEQLLRRVVTLLAETGDTAGALREYEAFAHRLEAEYDAMPAPETSALVARLRQRGAGASVSRARVPAAGDATPSRLTTAPHASGAPADAVASVAQGESRLPGGVDAAPDSPRESWVRRVAPRLAIAVAAVVIAVVAWGLARRGGDARSSSQPHTLAVLPFDVRGGHDLDYLSEGMADLLSIGLDGVGGIRSADPRLVMTMARREGSRIDPEVAQRIAQRIGAQLYVTGSVVEAGGSIALTGTLFERNGRVRATARTRPAEVARLFDLVDELARQLMAAEIGAPNELVGLAARTTKSASALRAFLDGERAIRSGRHAAALEAFQQAVTEDTTFALAYYRLGAAGRWMTDYALANDAAEKAARYGSALPSYARRLLTAQQAIQRGAYAVAESLYRTGIASRPGDVDAWFGLGDLYYHYNPLRGRSKGEGSAPFERALAIDPEDGQSRLHLLELSVWEGNATKVDTLLAGLGEGSDFAAKWPFVHALIAGDTAAERRIAAEFRTLNDRSVVRVVIHSASAFPSNLAAATRVLDLLTEPTRSNGWRAYGYHLRAQVELARGRWSAARADLTAMGALEPAAATEYGALLSVAPFLPVDRNASSALRLALLGWNAGPTPPSGNSVFAVHDGMHPQLRHYLLGLVSEQLGDTVAALRYADSLAAAPLDSTHALLARNLARGIRARVIRRRGDAAAALTELGEPWLDPRTHASHRSLVFAQVADRYLRAELLRDAGRLPEAIDAYGSVGDYSVDGLMYSAPSHLRRGEIYARMGDGVNATKHLRRFIDTWRECDPLLSPARDSAVRELGRLTR
jgi:serine/threonine-protein kinase